MPSAKTEITEIVTGLAITGAPTLAEALAARAVANVDEAAWERLIALQRAGQHRQEFLAAWANGQAFLHATDGLRGQAPLLVEWKGPTQAPGDEAVPADLRVDHVWLVSCKYLSKVLANAAPSRLFDRGLAGGPSRPAGDWYAEVAPDAYQALFAQVRLELGTRASLPPSAATSPLRIAPSLRAYLDAGWSPEAQAAYRTLAVEVGKASADRWRRTLAKRPEAEAVLWRLLRIGSAPYFVLGAQRDRTLRLRVMTPWDWRQAHELKRIDVWGDDAGSRRCAGRPGCAIAPPARSGPSTATWRCAGATAASASPPEAKVYLDTPHHRVPGYVELV